MSTTPNKQIVEHLELDDLLREYIFLKGQVEEMKPRLETAKAEILARTPEAEETVRVEGEQYGANVVYNAGREVIAWEEMPEYLKQMVNEYKRPGKPYRYVQNARRK